METIILTYNEKDIQARNLLNYILASGLLVPKIEKESGLSQAFEDIKKGRVYHAVRREKNGTKEPA
jgi:uncharacterized protein YktA (UPF0223 family)